MMLLNLTEEDYNSQHAVVSTTSQRGAVGVDSIALRHFRFGFDLRSELVLRPFQNKIIIQVSLKQAVHPRR